MQTNFSKLIKKYNIAIRGVCHVGCCDGKQEVRDYKDFPSILIEPNPEMFKEAVQNAWNYANICVFDYAIVGDPNLTKVSLDIIYSKDRTNKGCSSLYEMTDFHKNLYPWLERVKTVEVPAITLDDLIEAHGYSFNQFNFLNIDTEGYELEVLRGGTKVLEQCAAVYLEYSEQERFKGQALLANINEFLAVYGFELVEKFPSGEKSVWGDGLWIKKE